MKKDHFSEKFYLWFNKEVGEKMQQFPDICKCYGLEDSEVVERLVECGMNAFAYFQKLRITELCDIDGILDIEDFQFRKDLATLTNIFDCGRKITIQATMPDGEFKENHITIHIKTGSLLQLEAFDAFFDLLVKYRLEEYDGKTIEDIISFESGRIDTEKAMKGRSERTQTEIPRLGRIVHQFIKAGGDALAAMKVQKRYILIGDLMLAAGVNPVEQTEWKDILSSKDKADKVKSWEKSYIKTLGK